MSRGIEGAHIIAAVKGAGVGFVVTLPDIVTCDGLLWPMTHDPNLTVVPVCKEDEGVSICAGLSYADKRAILLMQHTGFLDSINAIRAIAVEYGLPVVMVVGLQGMEPDRHPSDSASYGLRTLLPIIAAMELPCLVLEREDQVAQIGQIIEDAYQKSEPFVVLVPQPPLGPEATRSESGRAPVERAVSR